MSFDKLAEYLNFENTGFIPELRLAFFMLFLDYMESNKGITEKKKGADRGLPKKKRKKTRIVFK